MISGGYFHYGHIIGMKSGSTAAYMGVSDSVPESKQ